METIPNLFDLEKYKIKYLKEFPDSKIDEDFYKYFINGLLPAIVKESADAILLDDVLNINGAKQLPILCDIHFDGHGDEYHPHIGYRSNFGGEFIFDYPNIESISEKAFDFFEKYGINASYVVQAERRIIIQIETDAYTLGSAIKQEQERKKDHWDPTMKVESPLEYVENTIGYLSDRYADIIHAYYYQKCFLDLIAKTYIKLLSEKGLRDITMLEEGRVFVQYPLYIGDKETSKNDMVVPREYLCYLEPVIKSFIENYNLGEFQSGPYAYRKGQIMIMLRAPLNRIREAYYMELYRIEHLLSESYYKYFIREALPTIIKNTGGLGRAIDLGSQILVKVKIDFSNDNSKPFVYITDEYVICINISNSMSYLLVDEIKYFLKRSNITFYESLDENQNSILIETGLYSLMNAIENENQLLNGEDPEPEGIQR